MKLKIKKNPGGEFENITIDGVTDEGIVLADVAETFKEELPYPALIARVNGLDTELTETVKEGDKVELLDMREHCANLVYQRGLSMIFLKAFEEVFEEMGESSATAEITNTLNNGFFISIRLKEKEETESDADFYDVPEDVVKKIETRMHRLVEADLPFNKEIVSKGRGCANLGRKRTNGESQTSESISGGGIQSGILQFEWVQKLFLRSYGSLNGVHKAF